jgi:integrase
MGTRRGNNEGTIFQRKDGYWQAALTLPGGKRKTYYGKSRKEAQAKLFEGRKALQGNLPLSGERQTLEHYLKAWLAGVETRVKPKTHLRYEQFVNNIAQQLGKVSLERLRAEQIQAMYDHYLKAGMSPTTVNHLHALLHVALKKAVKLGLLPRNETEYTDPPPVSRQERPTWTAEQARRFLDAIVGDPLEALYVLAIWTGMREGEILGLRWSNVDLKEQMLYVRETLSYVRGQFLFTTPKTRRSRRDILLADEVVEALQAHRQRQREEMMAKRDVWDDSDKLVFPNGVGHPIEASQLLKRSYYPLIEQAGLPRIHFHDLRHTFAHILKKEGVSTTAISEGMGHENEGTTDRFYGHVAPELQVQVVQAMTRALRKKSQSG